MVGLCYCLFYTEYQWLACVHWCLLPSLSDKGWSVFLCPLRRVSGDDLCSCVSYTEGQGLVCVIVLLTRSDKC